METNDELKGKTARLPDGQLVVIEDVEGQLATVRRIEGEFKGRVAVCIFERLEFDPNESAKF